MDQRCCPAEQEPNNKVSRLQQGRLRNELAAVASSAVGFAQLALAINFTSRCRAVANGYCTAIGAGILLHGLRLQGRQLFREGSRFCAGLHP